MTYQQSPHVSHVPTGNFSGLGIVPQILDTLRAAGFHTPTPIQERAIPVAVAGKDIIGIAQTGTGKTLAFGIPLIQKMLAHKGRAIILVPTRELAVQVESSLRGIAHGLQLRTVVVIGGARIGQQINQLRNNPDIIIGTPGRINDHIERRTLELSGITTVVLDEADRMLDLGFAKQIQRILDTVPRQRQTLLFSATMPADIVRIAQRYMQLPLRVEVAPAGTTAERVTQELFFVSKDQKQQLLHHLLEEYTGSVLVFVRTKHGAKKLTRTIRTMGYKAVELHGNRTLSQRHDALEGFKDGRYRILVATDIAARGIDVTNIELVLNYDLPENPEDYVHRIGRTGRAGKAGQAITFVQPDQRSKVRDIERLVRATLSVSRLPEKLPAPLQPQTERHEQVVSFSEQTKSWERPNQPRKPFRRFHRRDR